MAKFRVLNERYTFLKFYRMVEDLVDHLATASPSFSFVFSYRETACSVPSRTREGCGFIGFN